MQNETNFKPQDATFLMEKLGNFACFSESKKMMIDTIIVSEDEEE